MTVVDGTVTLPPPRRHQPLDGPLPDVLITVGDEYFVEWQVADAAPRPGFAGTGENHSLFP